MAPYTDHYFDSIRHPPDGYGASGFTLLELLVAIVVSGILVGGAAGAMSRFGRDNKVKYEASRLVDNIWEVRSKATSGMRNPCLDFPAPDSVRIYSDTSETPDGFGPGDLLLGGYRFKGGVTMTAVSGGSSPTHYVCFRSRGVSGSSLMLTLGRDANDPGRKKVRLLPSTGIAKVL
jgi:prepilin-type N-terminal cleavage/methylation domain-containing protein